MRSVSSIEPVGILNAWSTKVVPKTARMTVTTSDSTVSRVADFLKGGVMMLPVFSQPLEQKFRRALFGGFLASPPAPRTQALPCLHLNGEQFFMFGPAFFGHSVFGGRPVFRLKELLQSRLEINAKEPRGVLPEIRREHEPVHECLRGFEPSIPEECGDQGFQGVGQQRG